MFEWRGKKWDRKIWCIEMAFDAWRIAMGAEPRTFTRLEVQTWIAELNKLA